MNIKRINPPWCGCGCAGKFTVMTKNTDTGETVTKEQILEELERVKGPELSDNIVELGLVSEVVIHKDKVYFAISVDPARADAGARRRVIAFGGAAGLHLIGVAIAMIVTLQARPLDTPPPRPIVIELVMAEPTLEPFEDPSSEPAPPPEAAPEAPPPRFNVDVNLGDYTILPDVLRMHEIAGANDDAVSAGLPGDVRRAPSARRHRPLPFNPRGRHAVHAGVAGAARRRGGRWTKPVHVPRSRHCHGLPRPQPGAQCARSATSDSARHSSVFIGRNARPAAAVDS